MKKKEGVLPLTLQQLSHLSHSVTIIEWTRTKDLKPVAQDPGSGNQNLGLGPKT